MPLAPYGSWPSSISAESLATGTTAIRDLVVHGDKMAWLEGRPAEGGRQAVVSYSPGDGIATDALVAPWSARSRVHEYGGGALAVHGSCIYFVSQTDQRIWRLDPGREPEPITPVSPSPGSIRFGDLEVSRDGQTLACVRERHGPDDQVVNELVTMPTAVLEYPTVVAGGRDFYSAPRFCPVGRRLAWLCWDHPNMPWDGTELWTADGGRVTGGSDEWISQPRWAPDGRLGWVSDATGWSRIYLEGQAVTSEQADYTGPDWGLGQCTWVFTDDGPIAAVRTTEGRQQLVVLAAGQKPRALDLDLIAIDALRTWGHRLVAVAASATDGPAVVAIDMDSGAVEPLSGGSLGSTRYRGRPPSRPAHQDPSSISRAQHQTFMATGGGVGHAWFYPPANACWQGPPQDRPPLIVTSHGGPTGASRPAFDLGVQFWTTRGFALVDVDYRGSTGYGRAYRRLLEGEWAVADVDDCIAAAIHVADLGLVDRTRMVIRGRSAGGLTVLAALFRSTVFAAGTSHYGVTDMAALAADTHKFESRYLDRMVGPRPAAEDRYWDRSPVHHAGRITSPVLLLAGADDRVVPPSQADTMATALRANGVPCGLIVFSGEGHGFRRADTVRQAAEAELWFYGQVLGFEPVGDIAPVAFDPPLPATGG